MYNMGIIIADISIVVATVWIIKRYLDCFLIKGADNFQNKIIWIIFVVFEVLIEFEIKKASIWNTVINILLVLSISITGYKKGRNKFLIVILLYTIWALIEMFVFYCLNSINLNKSNATLCGSVISKILMIILVNFISVMWNHKENKQLPLKYFIFLLFTPVGSVFIAVNEFFEHQEDPETISSLAVFSILLMFNIALYQIYSKITEFLILEKERTVYIQQMKMISRNTNEQKRIMKDFQEEKHNLINELIVLKNSALNGNSKDVIDNLDKIICNFDKIRTISNSGNTTVDAIINFKYAAANSEGIQFKTSIIIPESLPINSCDLGIVLGNAIDNAIEATGECEISDRIIEIYVGIKKEALIIIIKNPYVHEIILDSKGNIKSTKEDSERHGYGIISMKKVVEKYCGDMLIESKDNIFIMTAIMNMGDFNSKYRKFDT